jgi:hypothetical protein
MKFPPKKFRIKTIRRDWLSWLEKESTCKKGPNRTKIMGG